ncbi:MAG: PHP domain-containing protein [Clostridia bacterium]|nr:PHP domain-containing protein [Clostridia bacterium]
MLPTPRNYAIYPQVVLADKPTEMTIVPTERAFLLPEGKEYTVIVTSLDDDEVNYHNGGTCHHKLTAVAHDGVLRFSYSFPAEGEHLIRFEHKEKKFFDLHVFSLYKDLYRLRPVRGDLHSHSYRSDGCQDPAAAMGHYREQGYDFYTLTDHNRYYPGGEIDEVYDGVRLGITRVRGEEVHAPGSVVHIVHAGGKRSVADIYVHDKPRYDREIAEYEARVPASVPERYKGRYARCQWITDRIHEAGGIAIFAHPYWRPGASKVYNVNSELTRILLTSGMFDAFELVGGQTQVGINCCVALLMDLREQDFKIPMVGSSDVHNLETAGTFPHMFTICFVKENENDAIIDAVKQFNCVAVEATDNDYNRHYRCYGSLRLVTYAQFLLKHYFPNLQRICQGEGVAMRAYAFDDASKALIESQVKQTDNYRLRFFGKKAPALPTADIRAFEEKWRAIHMDGPTGKGSLVHVDPPNRQI